MSKESFSKIKLQTPLSVIVHGESKLGYDLAKILIKQGSRVVIIGEYTAESKEYVSELKKNGEVDFIEFHGLEEFYRAIKRVDYIYYLHYDFLRETNEFNSRDFLHESNNLNLSLKSAVKHGAKFSLVSTIALNKRLAEELSSPNYSSPSPYSSVELQKYSETLTAEFYDKSKANVRILRLGELIGEDYEIHDETIQKMLEDAVKKDNVSIIGEGLDTHYIIHPEDAKYGIIKLTLANNTKGEVISLCNKNEYTTLSIAYKILELNPNASNIHFEQEDKRKPIIRSLYIPAALAENFGWTQKHNIEIIIASALESEYKKSSKKWSKKPSLSKKGKIDYESLADKLEKPDQSTEEDRNAQPERETHTNQRKKSNVRYKSTPLGNFIKKITYPFSKESIKKQLQRFSVEGVLKFVITTAVLVTLYYFIVGPLVTLGVSGALTYNYSKKAYKSAVELDFDTASKEAEKSIKHTNAAYNNLQKLEWFFKIIKQDELFNDTDNLVYASTLASEGLTDYLEALSPLARYIDEFEPALDMQGSPVSTTREYREYLREIEQNRILLNKASYNFSIATQYASSIDPENFPKFLREDVEMISKNAEILSTEILTIQKSVNMLPELLGVSGRKRYLVLLQNPGEIRSTGGWISSYALVGIEGGQIRELVVDDVYNVDGILRTNGKSYAPPIEMREALGINQWGLSLSNWSTDFPTTASNAEYFVKEAGVAYSLDGVITINISFIQDLLEVWGGLDVNSGSERTLVTSENIYDKILEMHVEYVPGSEIKSEFLANLADATIKKLLVTEPEDYLETGSKIFESLNKKDIILHIKQSDASSLISGRKWNSALINEYSSSPFLIEWNWGGNKANLFLEKTSNLEVNIIDESEINYDYTYSITNTSTSSTYPEGDYQNYIRIYLPNNAVIRSLDGFELNRYETYNEGDYKVIAGWFNVPIRKSRTLKLSYTYRKTPLRYFPIEAVDEGVEYHFLMNKQPGDRNHNVSININYPTNKWIMSETEIFRSSGSSLIYQGEIEKNIEERIYWDYR